ncbi:hypothetical protein HI914_05724 [Erysiphe necator]|nr:hypothetical protein HI914_05724 [Erysiphe necator]
MTKLALSSEFMKIYDQSIKLSRPSDTFLYFSAQLSPIRMTIGYLNFYVAALDAQIASKIIN